jgi:site-specific DNA-methyltransferase (adenine-specific)
MTPRPVELNNVYHMDCGDLADRLRGLVNLVYADILYDKWEDVPIEDIIRTLVPGGALYLQTDQRSVAYVKRYLDDVPRMEFINWIIWAYDWGGRSKDRFGKKHDDILYYAKPGGKRVFNASAVSIPKTVMINSTKAMKIPTDVWLGNFYTTSLERIKNPKTGKGYVWQKPEWLLERIIKASTIKGQLVFEPYLGTGTACAVAKRLGRHYIGCDTSAEMVRVASTRLTKV